MSTTTFDAKLTFRDGSTVDVRVEVDMLSLAQQYGYKAANSIGKRASVACGAVKVYAENYRVAPKVAP